MFEIKNQITIFLLAVITIVFALFFLLFAFFFEFRFYLLKPRNLFRYFRRE